MALLASDWSGFLIRVARSPLVCAQELKRSWMLALFWCKIGPFKCPQTHAIPPRLSNPLLLSRSRPFICIGRSSTPAAQPSTLFSWAQRHILARRSSGGERRPCHPRPSSCTYFLPSIACVCCPPAASSSRLLLPPVVLTRPPVVLLSSPFSSGAARRRGGHHALKVGAFEHLPAEHLRAMPAASLGQKNRRLRRAESDRGMPLHGAAGAVLVASVRSFSG